MQACVTFLVEWRRKEALLQHYRKMFGTRREERQNGPTVRLSRSSITGGKQQTTFSP